MQNWSSCFDDPGPWKMAKVSVASSPAAVKITSPPGCSCHPDTSYTLLLHTNHASFGLRCLVTSDQACSEAAIVLVGGLSPPFPIFLDCEKSTQRSATNYRTMARNAPPTIQSATHLATGGRWQDLLFTHVTTQDDSWRNWDRVFGHLLSGPHPKLKKTTWHLVTVSLHTKSRV